MVRKIERTMDAYIEAGAWVRLFELVGHKTIHAMSPIISAKDVDRMIDMVQWKFGRIKAGADAQLFRDFPSVSNDALRVFYGDLGRSLNPCGELDRRVIERAKDIVKSLLTEDEEIV